MYATSMWMPRQNRKQVLSCKKKKEILSLWSMTSHLVFRSLDDGGLAGAGRGKKHSAFVAFWNNSRLKYQAFIVWKCNDKSDQNRNFKHVLVVRLLVWPKNIVSLSDLSHRTKVSSSSMVFDWVCHQTALAVRGRVIFDTVNLLIRCHKLPAINSNPNLRGFQTAGGWTEALPTSGGTLVINNGICIMIHGNFALQNYIPRTTGNVTRFHNQKCFCPFQSFQCHFFREPLPTGWTCKPLDTSCDMGAFISGHFPLGVAHQWGVALSMGGGTSLEGFHFGPYLVDGQGVASMGGQLNQRSRFSRNHWSRAFFKGSEVNIGLCLHVTSDPTKGRACLFVCNSLLWRPAEIVLNSRSRSTKYIYNFWCSSACPVRGCWRIQDSLCFQSKLMTEASSPFYEQQHGCSKNRNKNRKKYLSFTLAKSHFGRRFCLYIGSAWMARPWMSSEWTSITHYWHTNAMKCFIGFFIQLKGTPFPAVNLSEINSEPHK